MEPDEIVKKLDSRQAEKKSTVKDELDLGVQVRVNAEDLGNQKKRAVVSLESPEGSAWSITCDEGAYLGGEDTAPPPLAYFSAGIAF